MIFTSGGEGGSLDIDTIILNNYIYLIQTGHVTHIFTHIVSSKEKQEFKQIQF